ncbi:MAG: hypothetical protein H6Q64_1261 [Firmicutes bacterium]|nr:hypothetical protein [Bacillota bacterium]
MKKLITVLLSGILLISLAGCGNLKEKKEDVVTVLPKGEGQELAVVGMNEVHAGSLLDISPDKKTVLFTWNGSSADAAALPRNLYTTDLTGHTVSRYSTSDKYQDYARFSPDGKKVVTLEHKQDYVEGFISANKANADRKMLKETEDTVQYPWGWCPEELSPVSWTSDSHNFSVAFSCYRYGNNKIFIFDENGKRTKEIDAKANGLDRLRYPCFLNNETVLAVGEKIVNHQVEYGIYAFSLNSKTINPKKVVDPAGREHITFAVSPNKKMIAYAGRVKETGMYEIKADAIDKNLNTTLLGATGSNSIRQITWSPDNQHLVYVDGGNMWLYNPSSCDKKQIVSMNYISKVVWINSRELLFSGIDQSKLETEKIYDLKLN